MKLPRFFALIFVAATLLLPGASEAVILFRTGDPAANTTQPTGPGYAESGWQYEGFWGGFLGTPIAPQFFISAAHVGNAGILVFNGSNYRVIQGFPDPESDLVIWQVAEEFPTFAPLYTRTDEVGQRLMVFGRGTQRGSAVMLEGVLKGWNWGLGDGVFRWGENMVAEVVSFGPNNQFLKSDFNEIGLPNECHLSSGDSGGAAFIRDGLVWKLAGIHYAVDGPLYTSSTGQGAFTAALFDSRGHYNREGNSFVLISGPAPVPTAFYPTRISTKLPWIAKAIAAPQVQREGDFLALTYTKLIVPATDLTYTVEQSIDLVSWEPATTMDEVVSTSGSTQVVKSKVTITGERLFLRLATKRP